MRELSYAGFGVLHDEAILPAVHAGIPIRIRNTNHPDQPGTRIVAERRAPHGQPVGIASREGFCTVFVGKYLMNREVGFGRRFLQIFEEQGISFEHMPSGVDNISIILREAAFDPDVEQRVTRRIRADLDPDSVDVERGLALVMLVGEGMRFTIGLAARACRALADAGVNIEMINQGSSEISMMFGVKSGVRYDAIRALYKEFFAAGGEGTVRP
jgi:aspartate kinase